MRCSESAPTSRIRTIAIDRSRKTGVVADALASETRDRPSCALAAVLLRRRGLQLLQWAGPIFFAPAFSHAIAYVDVADASTLRFWGDFGFAVMLVGAGYAIVAFDVDANRGNRCGWVSSPRHMT